MFFHPGSQGLLAKIPSLAIAFQKNLHPREKKHVSNEKNLRLFPIACDAECNKKRESSNSIGALIAPLTQNPIGSRGIQCLSVWEGTAGRCFWYKGYLRLQITLSSGSTWGSEKRKQLSTYSLQDSERHYFFPEKVRHHQGSSVISSSQLGLITWILQINNAQSSIEECDPLNLSPLSFSRSFLRTERSKWERSLGWDPSKQSRMFVACQIYFLNLNLQLFPKQLPGEHLQHFGKVLSGVGSA